MSSLSRSQGGRIATGCLGPGCLVALLVAFLTASVIGYVIFRSMRSAIDYYTGDTLHPLEVAEVPERDRVSVSEKLTRIRSALADGTAVAVKLSSAEVSALPWSEHSPRELRNKVALWVAGNQIHARFSFRLSDVGSFGIASAVLSSRLARAVEGEVAGLLSIKSHAADLRLTALKLQGHPFEDVALDGATVWCKGALNSYMQEYGALADRFQSLEVKDGSIDIEISPEKRVSSHGE